MPAVTLYDISITTFLKSLKTLSHILDKAESYAKDRGKDPDAYVSVALAADMKPLSFQVQVVSNTIKKSVWRLTGVDAGNWLDDETTIADLKARVRKTADLLQKIDPKSLEGKDDTMVELQMGGPGALSLSGKAYVLNYAIPNVFFHLQTTYAILRTRGVPLGKSDYLGGFMN